MKIHICVSATQFALITSLSALAGAGIVVAAVSLRPVAAHAGPLSSAAASSVPSFTPAVADDDAAKAGKACPVVHFDIGCKDSAKTQAFYSNLFDWKIKKQGGADMIDTGSKEGIQGHITSLGHEPEHYVTFYVQVSDINAYLEKSGKLGGKTLVPAVKIPTGQFAWISDPDGNIIGLIQQKAATGK